MSRPKLLDLFCGAGGAAKGYHDAGFDIVGVDIDPQPNYPYPFQQADALAILGFSTLLREFDAIHASPPCQGYSDLRHRTGREYPQLVEPVREGLVASGLPYVIENVEGAPLHDAIVLCGTMFPELRVLRHRQFETNFYVDVPPHKPHPLVFTYDKRKRHFGQLDQDVSFVQVTGGGNCTLANARDAMGIDWMSKAEINESIPPAYTEYIGKFLMEAV